VSAALERCHNIKFTSSILTSHNKLQCNVCGTILTGNCYRVQSRTKPIYEILYTFLL